MSVQVEGDPHRWPRRSGVAATECALIVVDMQDDYCLPGYYLHRAVWSHIEEFALYAGRGK